jgi:putative sigma-54 modulation protein
MDLQITGKNLKIQPDIRERIEKKTSKLDKHLPNIMEANFEITEEHTKSPQQRFVVQITLNSAGTILRAEERSSNLVTAIDRAVEVMDRQVEHFKGRLYEKGRTVSIRQEFANEREKELAATSSRISKVKQFKLQPMTPEEAIDRMLLLDHDFFLFINSDTDRLNLVYRRRNDSFGLIDTQ